MTEDLNYLRPLNEFLSSALGIAAFDLLEPETWKVSPARGAVPTGQHSAEDDTGLPRPGHRPRPTNPAPPAGF